MDEPTVTFTHSEVSSILRELEKFQTLVANLVRDKNQ